MSVYLELFSDGKESIISEFDIKEKAEEFRDKAVVLVAYYSYEDYSGSAYVLYEQGGKLYEVWGGHCSCNGLEGQWKPSETSWVALKHGVEKGERFPVGGYIYGQEAVLNQTVRTLISEHTGSEVSVGEPNNS